MRVLFALLWTSIAIQFVFAVGGFVLKAPSSASEMLDATIAAVTWLIYALVGAVLLWRRPEHRSGWLFAVVALGWSLNDFAGGYGVRAVAAIPPWPGGNIALWLDGGNGWPVWMSSGLLLMLVVTFPDGRLPSSRWRAFTWLLAVWTVAAVLATAFAAEPRQFVGGPADMNPFPAPPPIGKALAVLQAPINAAGLLFFAAGATALFRRFRRARGVERQQLKWFTASFAFVAAVVAVFVPITLTYGTQNAPPLGQAFFKYVVLPSVSLIPLAAGIAILRHRLYDIDLLIKRSLVYGATSAAIAGSFFLGIVALQPVLRPLTSGSELAVAASTLASFALFQPIRRRVQDAVDRRFDRSRYDAARTLDSFADRLRDEVDLDSLRADLVGAVNRTMGPSHASLWLRERTR
ncbi:MAG: hypothetical protein M3T56_18275 [Chloroflexota bacterium]|nr:hypothetical protein [Chloroflexota bacterium]